MKIYMVHMFSLQVFELELSWDEKGEDVDGYGVYDVACKQHLTLYWLQKQLSFECDEV